MKRGEIWWVEFDPALGSEIRKTRPAVILSNDAANRNLAKELHDLDLDLEPDVQRGLRCLLAV